MEFVKDQIIDYLSKRKIITLATTTVDGLPFIHPVAYVSKGPVVYFSTSKQTRKVKNIQENPKVAASVFDQTEFLDEIKSVQIEGIASIVTDKNEFSEAMKMLCQKFPLMADMASTPDSIIIKIEPKIVYFSDYVKRFGHKETVKF